MSPQEVAISNWNHYIKRRFDGGVPHTGRRIGDVLERDRNFRFWRRDVENNINARTAEAPAYKPTKQTRPKLFNRILLFILRPLIWMFPELQGAPLFTRLRSGGR